MLGASCPTYSREEQEKPEKLRATKVSPSAPVSNVNKSSNLTLGWRKLACVVHEDMG